MRSIRPSVSAPDSGYLPGTVRNGWLTEWKRNGWKTAKEKNVVDKRMRRMTLALKENRMKFRIWDIIGKKMLAWGRVMTLPAWEIFPGTPEQRAFDVMRSTGKKDMSGREIFENDIIENPNGIRMRICYGIYQAYCPVDQCYMDSVGFYAEAPGLPPMPIGPLEDYAVVTGNIYENPELIGE